MNSTEKMRYEARARVVKALAHPTRLYIVDLLARREHCVHELTGLIGADMSTVSKHLTILRQAGIIRDDKRGSHVYYQLKVTCAVHFFDCLESVVQCAVDELRSLAGSCSGKECSGE